MNIVQTYGFPKAKGGFLHHMTEWVKGKPLLERVFDIESLGSLLGDPTLIKHMLKYIKETDRLEM